MVDFSNLNKQETLLQYIWGHGEVVITFLFLSIIHLC